jgi:OPT family oligopeptide transporter
VVSRYVTCAQTLAFVNDLKLAHYIKIPPRQTFFAQIIATSVATLVGITVLNFQLHIHRVCEIDAPNRFYCPGINTFFTASVLWGTIGPKKVFGTGGQYTALLVGWPLGLVIPILFWFAQNRWQKSHPWVRQIHPVALLSGALGWAPFNFSYVFPAVPLAWLSWIWIKNRYLGFWSKYNFVLSASFRTGMQDISVDWWGNDVIAQGCEDTACTLRQVPDGSTFGPGPGQFS